MTEDELTASKAFQAAAVVAPVTSTATGGRIVDGIPIAKGTLPAGGLKDVPAGSSTDEENPLARLAGTLQSRQEAATTATTTAPATSTANIADLRKVASALGLSTKGTKADLSDRIAAALR